MREELVQLLWEQKRYTPQRLRTLDGRQVVPVKPGVRNHGQGPDFLQAELIIGDTRWAGNVEIHVDGLDWYRHGHHQDLAYNSVIAHVVWKPTGEPVMRQDGTSIPEIDLSACADSQSLKGYQCLVESDQKLPCSDLIRSVPLLHLIAAFESYGTERLLARADRVIEWIEKCKGDWETAFWIVFCGNWGGNKNRQAFENLAVSLPLKVLLKTESVLQKEALLLGMASMLEESSGDPYVCALMREWSFFQHKHQLMPVEKQLFHWGGMRPAQFPSIRLAQLAALLQLSPRLDVLLAKTPRLIEMLESLRPSEFWKSRYTLDKESKPIDKKLGGQFIDGLLINAVAPIRWVYAQNVLKKPPASDLADFLNLIPAEENSVTRLFTSAGVRPRTALDSQAMIHLHRYFCAEKRCLQCQIGSQIIRSFSG